MGAECVLARMVHEATVTRIFTPVELGEILQHRAYTATGQVNTALTKKAAVQAIGIRPGSRHDGPELAYRCEDFDPNSHQLVADALDAIKWAILFAGWTTSDEVASAWTDTFLRLLRVRRGQVPAIKTYYLAASWKLAMDMRSGISFDVSSEDIRKDRDFMSEHFDTYYHGRTEDNDHGKGKGKGRGKRDKGRRHSRSRERRNRRALEDRPPAQQRALKDRSPSRRRGRSDSRGPYGADRRKPSGGHPTYHKKDKNGKEICQNFNKDKCNNAACKRSHACTICQTKNCKNITCPQR